MLESLIGFAVLLGLILLRVPIAFAMAAVGGIGFALMRGWQPAWAMTGQVAFDSALSYSLSVIPLFIFMGNVLAASGVAHGLFAAADRLFGRTRGGLAMASVFPAAGSRQYAGRLWPRRQPCPRWQCRRCGGSAMMTGWQPVRSRQAARWAS